MRVEKRLELWEQTHYRLSDRDRTALLDRIALYQTLVREWNPDLEDWERSLVCDRVASRETNRQFGNGKPLPGDFLVLPDGSYRRVSRLWVAGLETTEPEAPFWMYELGVCDRSLGSGVRLLLPYKLLGAIAPEPRKGLHQMVGYDPFEEEKCKTFWAPMPVWSFCYIKGV